MKILGWRCAAVLAALLGWSAPASAAVIVDTEMTDPVWYANDGLGDGDYFVSGQAGNLARNWQSWEIEAGEAGSMGYAEVGLRIRGTATIGYRLILINEDPTSTTGWNGPEDMAYIFGGSPGFDYGAGSTVVDSGAFSVSDLLGIAPQWFGFSFTSQIATSVGQTYVLELSNPGNHELDPQAATSGVKWAANGMNGPTGLEPDGSWTAGMGGYNYYNGVPNPNPDFVTFGVGSGPLGEDVPNLDYWLRVYNVPEPATFALAGLGLAAAAVRQRARRS